MPLSPRCAARSVRRGSAQKAPPDCEVQTACSLPEKGLGLTRLPWSPLPTTVHGGHGQCSLT